MKKKPVSNMTARRRKIVATFNWLMRHADKDVHALLYDDLRMLSTYLQLKRKK